MGNECGGGSNLRAAEQVVRAMDPTRPTHYEAFGTGANNPAGIDSHMYTDAGEPGADRQGPDADQADVPVRVRPRDEQLDGLDRASTTTCSTSIPR